MSEKMFPIQCERGAKPHPTRIPWSIAELAYSVYYGQGHRSQTLERLAERGGFGPSEMDEFVPDWRDRCSELAALRRQLAEAQAKAEAAEAAMRGALTGLANVQEELATVTRERDGMREDEAEYRRMIPDLNTICTFNPVHKVFFRAGFLACREIMARFVEGKNKATAESIRANWPPTLGADPGKPRLYLYHELIEDEPGPRGEFVHKEISPEVEALAFAYQFIEQPIPPAKAVPQ